MTERMIYNKLLFRNYFIIFRMITKRMIYKKLSLKNLWIIIKNDEWKKDIWGMIIKKFLNHYYEW